MLLFFPSVAQEGLLAIETDVCESLHCASLYKVILPAAEMPCRLQASLSHNGDMEKESSCE